MTQPTQEDLEYVAKEIFNGELDREFPFDLGSVGPAWLVLNMVFVKGKLPDFYTDDSFTGALVKAVFPLLAENEWMIEFLSDGTALIRELIREEYGMSERVYLKTHIQAIHLNTALIEAYFKIKGEKNGN